MILFGIKDCSGEVYWVQLYIRFDSNIYFWSLLRTIGFTQEIYPGIYNINLWLKLTIKIRCIETLRLTAIIPKALVLFNKYLSIQPQDMSRQEVSTMEPLLDKQVQKVSSNANFALLSSKSWEACQSMLKSHILQNINQEGLPRNI